MTPEAQAKGDHACAREGKAAGEHRKAGADEAPCTQPQSKAAGFQRSPRRKASYIDEIMLWSIRNPGCPVCADEPRGESNYFFYYLHDGHAESVALEEVAGALGFCGRHGHRLLTTKGAESAIAAIHAYATRKICSELADDRTPLKLVTPDVCAACRSCDAHTQLLVHNLASILDDEEHGSLYGGPGLLCMNHLRMVLPTVSDKTFHRLLDIHFAALHAAFEQISNPDDGQPIDLEDALRLTIGHDRACEVSPDFSKVEAAETDLPDAVRSLAAQPRRQDTCPICREVEGAWLDWMRNVEMAVSRGDRVEDLVPLCSEHVRATMRYAKPALQKAAITRVLSEAGRAFEMARQRLEAASISILPRWRRILQLEPEYSRRRWLEAREATAWLSPCPLCQRLATASDRSLALLFELLRLPRHLQPIGHGLCLKHLSAALALDPPARQIMIAN